MRCIYYIHLYIGLTTISCIFLSISLILYTIYCGTAHFPPAAPLASPTACTTQRQSSGYTDTAVQLRTCFSPVRVRFSRSFGSIHNCTLADPNSRHLDNSATYSIFTTVSTTISCGSPPDLSFVHIAQHKISWYILAVYHYILWHFIAHFSRRDLSVSCCNSVLLPLRCTAHDLAPVSQACAVLRLEVVLAPVLTPSRLKTTDICAYCTKRPGRYAEFLCKSTNILEWLWRIFALNHNM